jgi:hypothetical protein
VAVPGSSGSSKVSFTWLTPPARPRTVISFGAMLSCWMMTLCGVLVIWLKALLMLTE